jgi:hypothetical protein
MRKKNELEMLNEYMTGLNIMIDAASQMVHQFQSLKWVACRDILTKIKDSQVGAIKTEVPKAV